MVSVINVYIPPFDMNLFALEVLYAHNAYRYLHNAPPLVLNPLLSAQSQHIAQQLLFSDNINESKFSTAGENTFIIFTNNPLYSPSGVDPVNVWYHLRDPLDYTLDLEDTNAVNFTQVVWKNTQFLGVGLARSENRIAIVCNYMPPGNISGQYYQNVLPVVM